MDAWPLKWCAGVRESAIGRESAGEQEGRAREGRRRGSG